MLKLGLLSLLNRRVTLALTVASIGLSVALILGIERLRSEARLPMVYVSHAVSEVARLADSVVLLRDGASVASGPEAVGSAAATTPACRRRRPHARGTNRGRRDAGGGGPPHPRVRAFAGLEG